MQGWLLEELLGSYIFIQVFQRRDLLILFIGTIPVPIFFSIIYTNFLTSFNVYKLSHLTSEEISKGNIDFLLKDLDSNISLNIPKKKLEIRTIIRKSFKNILMIDPVIQKLLAFDMNRSNIGLHRLSLSLKEESLIHAFTIYCCKNFTKTKICHNIFFLVIFLTCLMLKILLFPELSWYRTNEFVLSNLMIVLICFQIYFIRKNHDTYPIYSYIMLGLFIVFYLANTLLANEYQPNGIYLILVYIHSVVIFDF